MNLPALLRPFGGTVTEQIQFLQAPASFQFTVTGTVHLLTQWSSIPPYSVDKHNAAAP
jgi:hypothetical protein